MSQGRIAALDGLRGIAAVLVVLHHLPVWSPELNFQVLRNGHLMVPVFFVLSGFVIARTYGSQIHNGADLVRFQWRRVVRLYPVHLVMLLAFLLVEVAKLWAQGQGIVSPSTRAFRENSPTALLQHLLLIQSVGPTGHPLTFNAPAWSISAELWTYLTFGAVALLLQLHRVTAFALMAVGAALMVLLAPESGWNPMARCFAGFFLGAMLAEVRPRLPPPIAPAALVGLILVMTFSSGEATADLIAVALAGFTVAGLDGDAPVARVFEAKALQLLGSVSYSLYMGHALVVWIVNQVARLVLGGPELMVSGASTPQLPLPVALVGWGLALAGSLGLASLLHRYVEKRPRSTSAPVAAASTPEVDTSRYTDRGKISHPTACSRQKAGAAGPSPEVRQA